MKLKKYLITLVIFSILLSSLVLFPAGADVIDSYLWQDSFTSATEYTYTKLETGGTWTNNLTGAQYTCYYGTPAVTAEGTLQMEAAASNISSIGFVVPSRNLEGKPKLVLQFRLKPTEIAGSSSWIGTRNGYGMSTVCFYKGQIRSNAFNSDAIQPYTNGVWYTVTLVYDNEKTKRDIYIDGVYKGTFENHTDNNLSYPNTGNFYFELYGSAVNADRYYDLDDINLYALPANLDYEIESMTATSTSAVALSFNMIPDASTLISANFAVKDSQSETVHPSTVELDPAEPKRVILRFDEGLNPYSDYTLAVKDITAGSAEGSTVNTPLSLSDMAAAEKSFTTGMLAEVPYEVRNALYYKDYETLTPGTSYSTDYDFRNAMGYYNTLLYNFNAGQYQIGREGDTSFVTMTQNSTSMVQWRTYVAKENIPAADYYVVEYRVRPQFGESATAIFDSRREAYYGIVLPGFRYGTIYENDHLETPIGNYTDGEWVTVTTVYDGDYHEVEGVQCSRRDTYINGVYAATTYDPVTTNPDSAFIKGEKAMGFTLRIRELYTQANTGCSVDVDYIKMYAANETFSVKLPEETGTPVDSLQVAFNNIPSQEELKDKVWIEDQSGVKTAGIHSFSFENSFNPENDFAQLAVLGFRELEPNTEYKLVINGLTDIAGNKLYAEKSFTTGKRTIECGEFTLNSTDRSAATVSINVTNNSGKAKTLNLLFAGYTTGENGVVKMTAFTEKQVTVQPGENTFTSDAIDIQNCDYSQAFLWNGMCPVTPTKVFE